VGGEAAWRFSFGGCAAISKVAPHHDPQPPTWIRGRRWGRRLLAEFDDTMGPELTAG
jgi:hypothetical protein